jgi:glucokinase
LEHNGDYETDLKEICDSIKRMTDEQIEGIGICIPGVLNEEKTQIHLSANLPSWQEKPVLSDISEKFNCKVVLDQDVKTAALGESVYGYGIDKEFLFVIWGTGIGGTAVQLINKKPNFTSFELGHQVLNWKGEKCPCGQNGCFEPLCAGGGILKHYGKAAEDLNETEWDEVINVFSHCLLNTILIRPTELIILSGSIAFNQEKRLGRVSDILKEKMTVYPVPQFQVSKFKSNAGLYGALSLLV